MPDCGQLPGQSSTASTDIGYSVIAVKLSGRGRGWQGGAAAGLLTKIFQKVCKASFFEAMSEVQKDLEDVSAGIYIFLKIKYFISFPAI
jgi:hypothetical protein